MQDFKFQLLPDNQVMCINTFADCSQLGGYDLSDPCKQTCNMKGEDHSTFVSMLMNLNLGSPIHLVGSQIHTVEPLDINKYKPVQCTGPQRNCSYRGGYDSSDPCRQTCKYML